MCCAPAAHLIKPGDVLTIGETPVAVIQGRYRHPSEVEPGMVARLACRVFHPTSSLASGCGMQTLVDLVGPTRVVVALLGGLLLKLIGVQGGFYRLAGDQARRLTTSPAPRRHMTRRSCWAGPTRRFVTVLLPNSEWPLPS